MSSLIKPLKQRVEQTRACLEGARQATKQAIAHEHALVADLEGYEKALQAESRESGAKSPRQEADAIKAQDEAEAAATLEELSRDDTVNKTELVEKIIRELASSGGAGPAQVCAGFEQLGVPVNRNYVYSVLGRLLRRDRIRRRRGRYYPTEAEASPRKVVNITG